MVGATLLIVASAGEATGGTGAGAAGGSAPVAGFAANAVVLVVGGSEVGGLTVVAAVAGTVSAFASGCFASTSFGAKVWLRSLVLVFGAGAGPADGFGGGVSNV